MDYVYIWFIRYRIRLERIAMKRLILALIILLVPILSLIPIVASDDTASAGTLATIQMMGRRPITR
jgi:hypothetical protein